MLDRYDQQDEVTHIGAILDSVPAKSSFGFVCPGLRPRDRRCQSGAEFSILEPVGGIGLFTEALAAVRFVIGIIAFEPDY